MSYLPYKVTAIARSDNGDLNIIPGATVTVLTSAGGYATLREADLTTPILNPFNCDENGERQIYLQGGSYTFSVDGGQSWEVRLSGATDIQSVATIADLRLIEGAADDAQISLAGGDEIRGGLFRRVTDPSLSDDGVDVIRYAATDIYWVREDAEWYNDVHYLHPAIHNTAEVTVYCDPVTGSDTTGDGTLGNPWQTFQKAIDECPSCMLYKYNIDLKASALARGGLPAIYDEDVIIRDFRAPLADPANPFWVSAGIRIFGAGDDHLTDDPDDVQVRSLTISGCSGVANPEVLGLRVNAISPYYEQLEYIGIYGTKEAQLYNVKCSGLGGSGRAVVRAYGSGVSIKGIDITGADHALWAKRGAYGVVSDCYGTATASTVIVRSEEASDAALISQTVTGLTDARNIVTYNWGLTYDNSGILRVRGMYYGFPVIGSTLGTDALGLGYQFTASGSQSVSVGFNSISAGVTGVAVGAAANSGTQSSNTAIGASAATTGSGGTVGRRATAIGATASAAFENSTGLGYGATPSAANVVRIGNASVTKVETQAAYEVLGAGGAVYLKSPDGTRYALTIANGGAVTVTAAP